MRIRHISSNTQNNTDYIPQKEFTMVTYENDELVSSSEFAKKFGAYLDKIKSSDAEKLAILKNNHIEAVMLSRDNYEQLKNAYDVIQKEK